MVFIRLLLIKQQVKLLVGNFHMLHHIQSDAGVKFGFPAGAKELSVGQEWPVDFGKLTQAKRAKCGNNASAD